MHRSAHKPSRGRTAIKCTTSLRIISRLYENNIAGKVFDECYKKLTEDPGAGQKTLSENVVGDKIRLAKMKQPLSGPLHNLHKKLPYFII